MPLRPSPFRSVIILFLALAGNRAGAASPVDPLADFPVVSPESVGFSSDRLRRLDEMIQEKIGRNDFAGVVTIAARHGKIFQCKTYGQRDLSAGDPVAKDTIFRLHSMSKPVTGVAMMILYEEGKWSAQDPISKYIPEFAHLKVYKGVDANGAPMLEDPVHPPMMRELMTHTAGFTYGLGNSAEERLYLDAAGRNRVLTAPNLQAMINELASTPLIYQPGTRWVYSISVDIQGYLIEKLSGKSFPDFLRERIFEPLGMKDTGFFVPAGNRSRFSGYYKRTDDGKLVPVPADQPGADSYDVPPTRPSGGGGMVSTATDYFRFAEMLRNGGELGHVRILGPESVRMMSSNHLAPQLMNGVFGGGIHRMRPGLGFGYDFAVYTDPALADETTGKGTFLWLGAGGAIFWVDPTNDIVFVGMVNRLASDERPNLEALSRQALYQALIRRDL